MKQERKTYGRDFLMSLAATTISIILTFGTTAIINRHTRNAEKREMVMMIMYDMRETLGAMEVCNADLNDFFDLQVDLISHPQNYKAHFLDLAAHVPVYDYTTTTENIFRSNIETIKTIGNILFVELASSFYDERSYYKSAVDDFQAKAGAAIYSYEELAAFNSANYPFYSQSHFLIMKGIYEQCKMMMKVTDKDLEVFSIQRQKLQEATKGSQDAEERDTLLREMRERSDRLQQARNDGKKALLNN